ncbi:hypothetical protein CPC08DRAFT_725881 [Agrocybe pediades]|nr:hypothetical protein CPC08DRAFT_725881 [Agrocybe pediades]
MLLKPPSEQTKDTNIHSGWQPTDSNNNPCFDYTIETTSLVLNTLQDMASVTPVPYLSEAVAVAVRIVSITQASKNVKDRNQAFRDLANDAYGLNAKISWNGAIEYQGSNLLEIEEFAERKVKRGMIKKVIFHAKDIEKINRYRTLLRQSLDVFGIQSSISIQQNLDVILKEVRAQAAELELERLRQEASRLRAEGELLTATIEKIRLEEKIRTESLVLRCTTPGAGNFVDAVSILDGSPVI